MFRLDITQNNSNICPYINFWNEDIEKLYEDISKAMEKNKTLHYLIIKVENGRRMTDHLEIMGFKIETKRVIVGQL